MKRRSAKRGKRAAQATVLLGGFFAAVAASSDGHAYISENGSTTTTVICGVPITVPNGSMNGEGYGYNGYGNGQWYGEGDGNNTTIVSNECSPAAILAFFNANFQTLTNFYGNISNYMEMFRTGFGGPPPFTAYRPGAPTFQLASRGDLGGLTSRGNRPLFLAMAPSSVGEGTRFAVWAYGTGAFGHVSADGAAPGYRHHTGGFLAGFDWQSQHWMIGAHAGYAGSHIRVRDDGSKVSISHAIVGVHGALRWDSGPFATFYADGIFNVGFLDHDVTQSLTTLGFPGTLATGGPSGYSVGGKIEVGSIFRYWGFEFNPYSALQVVHLSTDSYTLVSSATTVAVGSVDTTSVRLHLAGQFGKRWTMADGSALKLNFRLGWIAELADTRQNTSVSALGGAVTFNTASNSVGRHFLLVGGNVHYQMGGGFGFLFDYRLETNQRATTHALLGGIRYTW
jgi:hypothetical protein